MKPKDILIFMSDQHGFRYAGFGGSTLVLTPELDQIAAGGTAFITSYTPCPLCVPARISMLTGQLPSRTGAFTNRNAIPEGQATFLHCLAAAGYETVLCGRMHFIGDNQRHGFTKRIMGDFTVINWGVDDPMAQEMGDFDGSTGEYGCLRISGGGNSPVLEYDRCVVEAALQYLREEHEKPQCIVVGTYAPHFPYVAPEEWYSYYKPLVDMPHATSENAEICSGFRHKQQFPDADKIRSIRAAYYGMISNMDSQIGTVYKAWKQYLRQFDRKGVFLYLSDHGDQIGERDLYGKKTFFESSSHIPMIFEGDGIQKGCVINSPVSLMDIGPTLCEMAGTQCPPLQDGVSLLQAVAEGRCDADRAVLSEYVDGELDRPLPTRMVRKGKWKLISYAGREQEDLLFDMENDEYELHNLAGEQPAVLEELRNILHMDWDTDEIARRYAATKQSNKILANFNIAHGGTEPERWHIPAETTVLPKVY